MNIFWHELRTHRQSLLIWALSLSLISILFIALYPSYSKDVDAIKEVFNNYPPALIKAFSLDINIFFSFLGFYSYILIYVVLAGAIQSLNLGIAAVAKENTDKTSDFLLAKPISRNRILAEKLFASVFILIVTNIIFIICSYIAANFASSDFNTRIFLLLGCSLFVVQLIFLALGLVISVSIKKVKSIVAISLPIVFGFYIVGSFQSIFNSQFLQYLSPLKYFDAGYIITNSSYQPKFFILSVVITVLCVMASFVIFNKKDIPSAT